VPRARNKAALETSPGTLMPVEAKVPPAAVVIDVEAQA
jgi:hypothetical protein